MTKAQAIAAIEECRAIHVEWADWQESDPNWRDAVTPDDPGGPEHHREWVEKYDGVLEVLRRAPEHEGGERR